jgi:hypothetical protein
LGERREYGDGETLLGGAGTQTAALAVGGEPTTVNATTTEKYDGTSWTPTGNLNTGRRSLAGAGTQTAAVAFWWLVADPGDSNATELEWFNLDFNGTFRIRPDFI